MINNLFLCSILNHNGNMRSFNGLFIIQWQRTYWSAMILFLTLFRTLATLHLIVLFLYMYKIITYTIHLSHNISSLILIIFISMRRPFFETVQDKLAYFVLFQYVYAWGHLQLHLYIYIWQFMNKHSLDRCIYYYCDNSCTYCVKFSNSRACILSYICNCSPGQIHDMFVSLIMKLNCKSYY